MGSAKDILVQLAGFVVSIIGGVQQDLLVVVVGVSFTLLSIIITMDDVEGSVKDLNSQIDVVHELDRLSREIEKIKHVKH